MGLYIIYIITIIIGIYALYVNIPFLIQIGIPKDQMQVSRFFTSFFPSLVGAFMVYFGISSIYNLKNKNKEENN